MLIGTDGVYSYTFEHEKREDCPVCGGEAVEMSLSSELTVEGLIELLVEKQDMSVSPWGPRLWLTVFFYLFQSN
jgi:ubiquitin-activating enzyme E1 C